MSLTGKNALSIRKKEVKEQNSLALGVKKIVFAHKATLGETGIDVTALVSPTEMSLNGFVNPNVADILASNMFFYRKNVTITSSAKNSLIQDLSFSIRSSSRINFLGFTAEEGEIFTVTIDQSARTSLLAVDASPISATGTLAAGLTDFNVGAPFQVNAFPIFQVGAVTVFVDGVQQFRNTNNQAAPADGNYYEVDPGGGFATLIRLNSSSLVDRDILVKSNGFAEKPDISQMAEIEKVQGQIDAMVPDLAQATGNPETNYQAAPNNIDLKQFGDRVLTNELDIAQNAADNITQDVRLDTLEAPGEAELYIHTGNGHGSTNTRIRRFSTAFKDTLGVNATYADSVTDGMSVTILIAGKYSMYYSDSSSAGSGVIAGLSVNATLLSTNLATLTAAQGKIAITDATHSVGGLVNVSLTIHLNIGDVVRVHDNGNMDNATDNNIFRISRVGN